MEQAPNKSRYIVGTRVDASDYEKTVERIVSLARSNCAAYVCVANVHMVMESFDDPRLRRIVNAACLVTADGMPLAWGLKLLGLREAKRVCGPTLTLSICEKAAKQGIAVAFYGSTQEILRSLRAKLQTSFPSLRIAYVYAPPFRESTDVEDGEIVRAIRLSGASILFVGLGCPKQERWMAAHTSKLQLVMLGVGAAFDFIAGAKPQAPPWMQNAGLEWLFRLITEPRRLCKRYLYHNPRFVYYFIRQLLAFGDY